MNKRNKISTSSTPNHSNSLDGFYYSDTVSTVLSLDRLRIRVRELEIRYTEWEVTKRTETFC